jgi:hypothetical protein
MIVKCIISEPSGESQLGRSPWLIVGKEYSVLSLYYDENNDMFYRIETNSAESVNSLGLFRENLFEVVCEHRPTVWEQESRLGTTEIGPTAWQTPGFWEDLYEGDEGAANLYKTVRDAIYDEERSSR